MISINSFDWIDRTEALIGADWLEEQGRLVEAAFARRGHVMLIDSDICPTILDSGLTVSPNHTLCWGYYHKCTLKYIDVGSYVYKSNVFYLDVTTLSIKNVLGVTRKSLGGVSAKIDMLVLLNLGCQRRIDWIDDIIANR